MDLAALGDVLPQATAIALSPIPIVLVVMVLVSPRARRSGPAFALGWVTGLFVVTALAYLMADSAGVATDPDASLRANLVQILLGCLFLFFAVQQWKKRPRPGVEPETPKLVGAIAAMAPLKSGRSDRTIEHSAAGIMERMAVTADALLRQALALGPTERARLASGLLTSLEGDPVDPVDSSEIERLWNEESSRRTHLLAAGQAQLVDWEHVTERINGRRAELNG